MSEDWARELAALLSVLSHPDRLRLVRALGEGEKDVSSLQREVELPGSRVSQHLALLRAHRLVHERRVGRRVFYRLERTPLSGWLLEGLAFVK